MRHRAHPAIPPEVIPDLADETHHSEVSSVSVPHQFDAFGFGCFDVAFSKIGVHAGHHILFITTVLACASILLVGAPWYQGVVHVLDLPMLRDTLETSWLSRVVAVDPYDELLRALS
jgi:hypothetical protein